MHLDTKKLQEASECRYTALRSLLGNYNATMLAHLKLLIFWTQKKSRGHSPDINCREGEEVSISENFAGINHLFPT